jgi:hypothetical protein
MLRKARLIFAVALLIFIAASAAYSKGSPDKIRIVSDGSRPVEITNREILKKFDPWNAQFIDWTRGAVPAPANQDHAFEVFFYMKWPGRKSEYDQGDLKLIYTVRYVSGGEDGAGYIYLPGQGEKYYRNNAGTIWREKEDGTWRQASPEWDAIARQLITNKRNPQSFVSDVFWFNAFWLGEEVRMFGA